jgi:hypothetical protein
MTRVVLWPVRIEPERVERVERLDLVLRADRVEGVRPERVDGVVCPAFGAAWPHTSQ